MGKSKKIKTVTFPKDKIVNPINDPKYDGIRKKVAINYAFVGRQHMGFFKYIQLFKNKAGEIDYTIGKAGLVKKNGEVVEYSNMEHSTIWNYTFTGDIKKMNFSFIMYYNNNGYISEQYIKINGESNNIITVTGINNITKNNDESGKIYYSEIETHLSPISFDQGNYIMCLCAGANETAPFIVLLDTMKLVKDFELDHIGQITLSMMLDAVIDNMHNKSISTYGEVIKIREYEKKIIYENQSIQPMTALAKANNIISHQIYDDIIYDENNEVKEYVNKKLNIYAIRSGKIKEIGFIGSKKQHIPFRRIFIDPSDRSSVNLLDRGSYDENGKYNHFDYKSNKVEVMPDNIQSIFKAILNLINASRVEGSVQDLQTYKLDYAENFDVDEAYGCGQLYSTTSMLRGMFSDFVTVYKDGDMYYIFVASSINGLNNFAAYTAMIDDDGNAVLSNPLFTSIIHQTHTMRNFIIYQNEYFGYNYSIEIGISNQDSLELKPGMYGNFTSEEVLFSINSNKELTEFSSSIYNRDDDFIYLRDEFGIPYKFDLSKLSR